MKLLLGKNRKFILLSILLMLLSSITALLLPLFLSGMSDQTTADFPQKCALILVVMVCSFCLQLGLLIYRQNYAAKLNLQHLTELLLKMKKMDYQQYNRLEASYLLDRIFTVVDSLYLFITGSFSTLIGAIFTLLAVLILASSIHWAIALLLSLLIPLNFFGYRWINQTLTSKMSQMQKNSAVATKDLQITLSNSDLSQQLTDQNFCQLFTQDSRQMYHTLADTNKFAQATSQGISFFNQFCQTFLYLFVSFGILQNQLAVTQLVMIGVLLPLFFNALSSLNTVNLDTNALNVSQEFIKTDLDANQAKEGDQALSKISSLKFAHPQITIADRKIPLSLEADLQPGDRVYLKGASGKGKSTLLKALVGFFPATGLFLNQRPLAEFSHTALRQRIIYHSQSATILSKTLAENIGLGAPLTEAEKRKIEATGILAPILAHKNWDSCLYENGANLSGGEKQRIAAARLLLQDADVYLFDEATSSIDPTSAEKIYQVLFKHAAGKILLYTSHNETDASYANKILEIN